MESFEYCLACLATDVKMYRISTNPSSSIIGEIVPFLGIPDTERQNYFCFECAAFLYKFERFRSKCQRAQDVLSRLEPQKSQITRKHLNLNRNQYHLNSSITWKSIENISITDSLSNLEEPIYDVKPTADHNYDENVIKSEFIQETILDHDDYDIEFINSPEISFNQNKLNTKNKEYKTKKRKVSDSSDDEPLINKINKEPNVERNHKKFDVSYFEDYATVEFLTQEDARKELLLRKESSNYINSAFKCELCYRGFEAKGTFENHMKKHSSDYGEYVCDICHLRFQEQRCLCKHRLASHKRKFTCNLCSYVCFCTHQAKTHVSLHKGKKYPCKECGEIFSMPNSLLMHKRLKHVTECVCDVCGDMFATSRGLYSHRVKVHRQVKNEKSGPKCEQCNIHFANEEAWKRHLVLSSKHNVSNGCKICGETFTNGDDLKSHMRCHARKHTNRSFMFKLPASCGICNKWLEDRVQYKSHMTSQHPLSDITKKLNAEVAPFVCELCGLTFKKACLLRVHQRRHGGAPPARAHARTNTAHKCPLCQRNFTYKSALNKHMKMHLNIRPHRCDICDKSFISPCDVRLHVKYVHNKVPWPKRERNKKHIV